MSQKIEVNGEFLGNYYEFKGGVKEAIKFMHIRQDAVEKEVKETRGDITKKIDKIHEEITNIKLKVAGIGAIVSLVVSILVLIIKALIT